FAGQKVGIVGANGSGKTSLLALIRGELHSEAGEVQVQPGITIGHVAQENAAQAGTALDFVLDGDPELRRIEAAIAAAQCDGVAEHDDAHAAGTALGELHERLAAIGGYGARARAARIMHGLGFSAADLMRPVEQLSGGWRMRLNLAQALMS